MSLLIEHLKISEVKVLKPDVYHDHRGFFLETYNRELYSNYGIECKFVQDNQSWSRTAGTVRAMHFQIPPFAQTKLVRVLKGAILDIAFDLRVGSPTYRTWCSAYLSSEENNQILVPAGFAHGFITLTDDTMVHYKVDQPYSKAHERGFIWNDQDAAINWGSGLENVVVSDKDAQLPGLSELPDFFEYDQKSAMGVLA